MTSDATPNPVPNSSSTAVVQPSSTSRFPVDDDKIIYFVDSDFRLTGSHSNFAYKLELPPNNNFDSVAVLQATIPKSYYLIAEGRNTFQLKEWNTLITITLPVGNYTRDLLASTLQNLLNAATVFGLTYTVTYPTKLKLPDTGKFTFTYTPQIDVNIVQFIFSDSGATPAVAMGFQWNSTYTFNTIPSGGTLTSVNVCKLQARDIVYIQSDMTENGSTAVLQEIFSSVPDFSYMVYKSGEAGGVLAHRKRLRNSRSNVYSFVVTDDDGVELDTNGINVVFSLVVWNSRLNNWQ